jgi:hypothetical protein
MIGCNKTNQRIAALFLVFAKSVAFLPVSLFRHHHPCHHPRRQSNNVCSLLSSDSNNNNNNVDDSLQVFDNVFSVEACHILEKLALDHAQRGADGSSIFRRDQSQFTPLEQALNSALEQLDDGMSIHNTVVEYWSRHEYINLDLHSDIDEEVLEEEGMLRYPEWAHVLYLNKLEPNLRGPTCVFPQKLGGWNKKPTVPTTPTTMVTVPAVLGRVLRFPGSAMHAVPKPNNRWLLSKTQEQELRIQEQEEEEDCDDDDDEDDVDDEDEDFEEEEDEDYEEERIVILFNTWSEQGPQGVSQDYLTGILPDGMEIDDDDDDNNNTEQQQAQQRATDWNDAYGIDCKDLWCRPKSEWTQRSILQELEGTTAIDTPSSEVRVSLMGKKERRLHPNKYAPPLAGPPTLLQGLEQETQPMAFQLKENTKPMKD